MRKSHGACNIAFYKFTMIRTTVLIKAKSICKHVFNIIAMVSNI